MIEVKEQVFNDPVKVEVEMDNYKINSLGDIYRALREHPEWALEIRKVLLSNDLLELPKIFDDFLRNDFQPLKEKVDKIEKDVEVLKQDVNTLKQDVTILKEDITVLKQDVAVLKQDVAVLKQDVAILKQEVKQLKDDVGMLKGDVLELKVITNIGAFLGKIIRKAKMIDSSDLADTLYDAAESGIITESEADDAHRIDAVVEGYLRKGNGKKILVALEISHVGDIGDLERAVRRAQIISKAYKDECIPMILAKSYTEGAMQKSKEMDIILI